ncbi:hypothetical protein HMPREF9248_0413 [Fannyhessea vaginae PB189-T1-4]|uniref:Uncharacterized protein n=1 Tax=Fannyhessea vaginae PB189-T1-4 TaxID=866774 RepID=A0ABN0B0V4_9ACTN|nr:hypothetical protein HMPREF9248_0413 [Fannyhessea vaginae PB189-T1-4]
MHMPRVASFVLRVACALAVLPWLRGRAARKTYLPQHVRT